VWTGSIGVRSAAPSASPSRRPSASAAAVASTVASPAKSCARLRRPVGQREPEARLLGVGDAGALRVSCGACGERLERDERAAVRRRGEQRARPAGASERRHLEGSRRGDPRLDGCVGMLHRLAVGPRDEHLGDQAAPAGCIRGWSRLTAVEVEVEVVARVDAAAARQRLEAQPLALAADDRVGEHPRAGREAAAGVRATASSAAACAAGRSIQPENRYGCWPAPPEVASATPRGSTADGPAYA
jgi:hypothetical protein